MFGAQAFLAAFITLFVQILAHRMVSAKLVNNFAFLVISLTMLGFAVSGVILTRWLDRFLANLRDSLSSWAALFVLTLIAASAVFYRAPVGENLIMASWATSTRGFVSAFLYVVPLALLYAVPFSFCGLILGALLSAPGLPSRRIYFFDLLGSAAGAFSVIPAISWLGVESSALLACLLLLSGTVALNRPRGARSRALVVAAAACLLGAWAFQNRVFAMSHPPRSFLGMAEEGRPGYVVESAAWDPVAHIEVTRIPPPDPEQVLWAALLGNDHEFLARFRRVLTQNNTAFTYAVEYDGRRESLRGIERTIYAAAYETTSVSRPRVLVIGVGGGFDVLTALYFDARQVTGVEVNAATVRLLTSTYRDYFRHWVEDPRVRLVHDEGRHHLSADPALYDVIQLSGVDSASGTPAAAHVFSESYIYTVQAFELYLSRLTPDGIINMMRQEWIPPREMLRALTTATAALRAQGVARPAEHVLMLTATNQLFSALLVKKTPFTPEERRRLADWAAQSPYFRASAASDLNAQHANAYQAFLSLSESGAERYFTRLYPFDVRPVDDDRPFFFKHSFWWHLRSDHPALRGSVPVMEYGILLLLALTGIAALVCVYLPLRLIAAQGLKVPRAARFGVYFAAIGLGFLAIEMALLQKFGLFLGHPNYALSVVLASLLLASGLGSLFSARITGWLRRQRFVAYLLSFLVLLELLALYPRLPGLVGAPFAARVILVCLLVAPLGLCLGTFFPSALERLKQDSPAFVPWAWGLNGIFSVVAPVISVAISMTWGIEALLLSALPFYLAAALAFPDAEPPSG